MSDPALTDSRAGLIETVVDTREREIVDGFKVRRVLPSSRRRMVGPFTFLDQMGPEHLAPGTGLDVAPHPHIGLATVTYLFEGELLHRDGLGTVQTILPGEVNWMTAGSGLAHSERTPRPERVAGGELFGIQAWVALPKRDEEMPPGFVHYGSGLLPVIEGEGKVVRVICGDLFGKSSPVETRSAMFYADVSMEPAATLSVPQDHAERAVYIVSGSLEIVGDRVFSAGQLMVLKPAAEIVLRSDPALGARIMLLGGEPLDGKRHIWWNFVSSSTDRIEQAKANWRAGRFAPVPDETEYIPLPEGGPAIVRYP